MVQVISIKCCKLDRVMVDLQEKEDNSVRAWCIDHELMILVGEMTWYLFPLVYKVKAVPRVE